MPCEILMGTTGLNHKSNPQITFLLQLLAMLNGFCSSFALLEHSPWITLNPTLGYGLYFTSLEQGAFLKFSRSGFFKWHYFGQNYSLWWKAVHCRMSSSIPGLFPLDAGSIPSIVTITNVSGYCQLSPGG